MEVRKRSLACSQKMRRRVVVALAVVVAVLQEASQVGSCRPAEV